jgi:hypothetical protein
MIAARREAQEGKEQAAIDWNRYKADQAYRQQIEEQERQRRAMRTLWDRHNPGR